MAQDTWKPEQYEKFKQERYRPAYDLMDLILPKADMRVVDLGCGTGELTAEVHERLTNPMTVGIDRSESMLAKARAFEGNGLEFRQANIAGFVQPGHYDLIFSNAALQWVPDHEALFGTFFEALRAGGQLAIQVPRNQDHPSQTVAFQLSQEEPYAGSIPAKTPTGVLEPETYVLLLDRLGFQQITVRMQVYLHHLESREAVVEWVKGTLLTDYEKALTPEMFSEFLEEYRKRLRMELEDLHPFPFTFKRILMHAVKP